jgi:penicillin-binding protein 1A
MRVALEGKPVAANDPPDGMVRVAVGQGGQLLPEGSGGIVEWVKAEDLERMQVDTYSEYDESASEREDAFDIF